MDAVYIVYHKLRTITADGRTGAMVLRRGIRDEQ